MHHMPSSQQVRPSPRLTSLPQKLGPQSCPCSLWSGPHLPPLRMSLLTGSWTHQRQAGST
ncbi:unnamed protein product, partial [Gulo gulo]